MVFALNAIVQEKSPQFSGWFRSLDRPRTVALDDHTVRVVFGEARVAQLPAFNIGVLPAHVHAKQPFKEVADVVELHALLARDQPYLWTVRVASKWTVYERVQNVRVSRGFGLFLWSPGPLESWLR